ncbi:hypothetical protein ADK67_25335 [Saccharothrix sp. NRRL B-16348]|uniref:hypothetical protein n=1 Tax=Saccharothrix sp. NRRL B-16348 TaxID=1415542 RepID=UPI0006AF2665|nr:hypothetical protein [Saccharothrix sp. NRRL B-16348]KOX21705.1 hypothetical protein ADK67_25335 [Saccharothrix sp. NRRL B-16348]
MDKHLFDEAIGEVPPSTVDVDAVIARGRRGVRLRRVANPAVAAGMAVVVLTGAVAYTLADGRGTPVGGPPGTTSAVSPSSTAREQPPGSKVDAPSVVVVDDKVPPPECEGRLEPAAEAAARLTLATTDAVKAQRPDLGLSANPAGDYPAGTPHGPLDYHQVSAADPGVELSICDPKATFEAMATTTTADGSGNIFVLVEPTWRDGLGPVCAFPGLGTRTSCVAETGTRGEEIVKQTADMGGGITLNQVLVHREDGTRILVQAENIATSGKTGGAPTSSEPPLTLDQLVAIGVDPALTMFPG